MNDVKYYVIIRYLIDYKYDFYNKKWIMMNLKKK